MPDPDLTSNNCDGETSTVQLGTDPTSLTPNKRFGIVKRDNRTIVNDDALAAPANGGDLPGGLKVNICSEDAERPYAARVTGTPINATGVNTAAATVPAPTGTNMANALRMQQDAAGNDCGLLVSPPKFTAVGNMPRVDVIENPTNGGNDPTLNGDKIGTITLTNPDSVPRLFRVKGRFSCILHIQANALDTLAQIIYRSKLNDHPTNHLDPGAGDAFVGGGSLNSRVANLDYPDGNYAGFVMNDQRDFLDELILPPGVTRYLHFYTSTIRSLNIVGAADTNPDNGVNVVGVSVEELYAVGGA